MQRGLRVITLHGAIEKSPILLSQYWKNELLDGNIIISYFGGSNSFFDDCTAGSWNLAVQQTLNLSRYLNFYAMIFM